MPQGQAGQLEHSGTDSAVFQRLEGVDGKHQIRHLLMLSQLPAGLQRGNTVEKTRQGIFSLAETIPSWHILSEFLIDHENDGHDMLIRRCFLVKVWPEIVLQILGYLKQHDPLQLWRCVLLAIQLCGIDLVHNAGFEGWRLGL